MARRGTWIGMAMAIPATVAFTPFHPLEPPPPEPHVLAPAQPVVATTPVAAAPATPASLPPESSNVAPPDRDVGSIVVDAVLTRVGAPYAWGAAGPDSFDCSGLVVWAFHEAGIALPHSSQALASGGQEVSLDQMQLGDVISFFPDASHVGIYVGDGRVVDAPYEDEPVAIESLDNAPINSVRRYG